MSVEILSRPSAADATPTAEYLAIKNRRKPDLKTSTNLQKQLVAATEGGTSNTETKRWVNKGFAAYFCGVITARPDLCQLTEKNIEKMTRILEEIHDKAHEEDSVAYEETEELEKEILAYDWMQQHQDELEPDTLDE